MACLALTASLWHPGDGSNLGYSFGFYLLPAVVLWALFRAVFINKDKPRSTLAFGVILASLMAGALFASLYQKSQIRKASATFKAAVTTFENAVGSNGIKANAKLLDAQPKASGEMGEMERWLKESLNKMITLGQAHSKRMEDTGRSAQASFTNLDGQGVIQHRLETGATLLAMAKAHKEDSLAMMQNIRAAAAQNPNISQKQRDGMLKGFDEACAQMPANLDLEVQSYDLSLRQFLILAKVPRHWKLVNGKLLFYDNQDLAAFNGLAMKIQEVQARLEAVRKEGQEKLKGSLKDFETLGK